MYILHNFEVLIQQSLTINQYGANDNGNIIKCIFNINGIYSNTHNNNAFSSFYRISCKL